AALAAAGEERTARVGDVLFQVGDATYPFIAIREGEVAILDAAGKEIVRHGASSFLGELNLLSGQTVFLTAVVTKPLRYVAVDRRAAASCSTRREARCCARSGSGASWRCARRWTCSSSAAAPPASPPPSTAPRRDSKRSSSRAPPSAARPDRPAGSRTTSAS